MLLQMDDFPSFFKLNSISLSIFVCVSLYLCMSTTFSLYIHLLTGCFHILTIVNKAAENKGVQISFWDVDCVSFGNIARSGITGSYGFSIFNTLRSFHTVLHSGAINLHPPTMHRGSLFPTFLALVIFWHFDSSHFKGVRW